MKKRQKTPFGEFLVKEIKKAEMSQEEFYKSVDIKKPYFYDILTGSPPPTDLQNKMIIVLEKKTYADPKRRNEFYNLAAQGRKEIPADIAKLISEHYSDLDIIRSTLNNLFSV